MAQDEPIKYVAFDAPEYRYAECKGSETDCYRNDCVYCVTHRWRVGPDGVTLIPNLRIV